MTPTVATAAIPSVIINWRLRVEPVAGWAVGEFDGFGVLEGDGEDVGEGVGEADGLGVGVNDCRGVGVGACVGGGVGVGDAATVKFTAVAAGKLVAPCWSYARTLTV